MQPFSLVGKLQPVNLSALFFFQKKINPPYSLPYERLYGGLILNMHFHVLAGLKFMDLHAGMKSMTFRHSSGKLCDTRISPPSELPKF